jgi:hypothetical protein
MASIYFSALAEVFRLALYYFSHLPKLNAKFRRCQNNNVLIIRISRAKYWLAHLLYFIIHNYLAGNIVGLIA